MELKDVLPFIIPFLTLVAGWVGALLKLKYERRNEDQNFSEKQLELYNTALITIDKLDSRIDTQRDIIHEQNIKIDDMDLKLTQMENLKIEMENLKSINEILQKTNLEIQNSNEKLKRIIHNVKTACASNDFEAIIQVINHNI